MAHIDEHATEETLVRLAGIHGLRQHGLPVAWDDVDFLLEQLGRPVVRRKRCETCNATGVERKLSMDITCRDCGGKGYQS